jgi:DNA-binding XRE family transcriptional regulator
MFVKITSVATLPDYILLVGFSTGDYKQFDLKPLIEKYPAFASLKNVNGLYEQVKIDIGGYGLVWNDELDISADGLYEKGTVCQPPENIEKYKTQLIEELVQARKNANLSQKQLEILSGIAQPCIARTEKGNTDPKLSTLLKMLEPLGLTLSITSL